VVIEEKDTEQLERERLEKLAKRAAHRERIVGEIRDTEETYVNKLRSLDNVYIKALNTLAKRGNPIIPAELIARIFAHVVNIMELNAGLLRQLDNRAPEESLAQIFINISPYLKLYTAFINGYDDAMRALGEAMANPDFVKFTQECSANPGIGGLSLPSLLIMPVQRIPRYELLLRDLIKYTEEDHPDKPLLEVAMEKVVTIAKQVNESKERQERMAKVWEIQNKFAAKPVFEPLVIPTRRFVREDVMTKKPSSGKAGRDRLRTFFLFNDVVVYATVAKNATSKLEFKGIIDLMAVKAVASAEPTGFELLSGAGTFRITADTEKVRNEWVAAITELQAAIQDSIVARAGSMLHLTRSNTEVSNGNDSD
jgi:hypothetical protein